MCVFVCVIERKREMVGELCKSISAVVVGGKLNKMIEPGSASLLDDDAFELNNEEEEKNPKFET